MNVVKDTNGKILDCFGLAREANALYGRKHPFTCFDFGGFGSERNRIAGNHCFCNGDGDFRLLPVDSPEVKDGGKRYMICEKYGGWSHL